MGIAFFEFCIGLAGEACPFCDKACDCGGTGAGNLVQAVGAICKKEVDEVEESA